MNKKSNTGLVKSLFLIIIPLSIQFSCNYGQQQHTIIKSDNRIEICNSKVRAVFVKNDSIISQKYYARNQKEWQEVVSAFIPPSEFPNNAVQLFNKDLVEHRFLSNSILTNFTVEKNNGHIVVTLQGEDKSVPIVQEITLSGENDYFHFSVNMELPGYPAKLDYALSTFTFNLDHAPFFVHTPGLKFDNEDSKQNRFKLLPGKDRCQREFLRLRLRCSCARFKRN